MPSSGATVSSGATAWAFGSWATVLSGHPYNFTMYGLTFAQVDAAGIVVDTTIEALIEIGVGTAGNEVMKAQIPFTFRADTKVGYYMTMLRPFLAEPILVDANIRVAARAADSVAAALTYNGISIYMREIATPPVPELITPTGVAA